MATPPPSPTGMALAAALHDDPFYAALVADLPGHSDARRICLGHYFDVALREGATHGRAQLDSAERGAAIWLLPEDEMTRQEREAAKHEALQTILGPQGFVAYAAMIAAMEQQTAAHIPPESWYLSILGVDPRWQGQGLGAALLTPILAEIDRLGLPCYLETFSERSVHFYQRHGFTIIATHQEPLTVTDYHVLLRPTRGIEH
jgi:GNAT superfamily N-acetyltransferase